MSRKGSRDAHTCAAVSKQARGDQNTRGMFKFRKTHCTKRHDAIYLLQNLCLTSNILFSLLSGTGQVCSFLSVKRGEWKYDKAFQQAEKTECAVVSASAWINGSATQGHRFIPEVREEKVSQATVPGIKAATPE